MIKKARREGKRYINPVPTAIGGWSTFFKILRRYLDEQARAHAQADTGTVPDGYTAI